MSLYTLNPTAIGVRKGLNKRWANINLNLVPVPELFEQYRIVQIELTPAGATDPVFLLLEDIASEYAAYLGMFQGIVDDRLTAFPTRNASVQFTRDVARFYDVFELRYKVRAVDDENQVPVVAVDFSTTPHLRIERSDAIIDSAAAIKQVLVSVNGFYHYGENIGNKGLFVRDGYKSVELSNQNSLGLWDFQELGGFTVVPDIPATIPNSGGLVQVNFPQDVTNKSVFFVIAGYFFPVDVSICSQVGLGAFTINFNHVNMRLVQRYFEAANYIDLSSVKEVCAGATPGMIDTDLLNSPEAIAAWLDLTQSFAVIVNRKNTYIQQRYVKRTGNPNQYECYLDRDPTDLPNEVNNPRLLLDPPQLPLALELGRHPAYWTTTERWVHLFTIYSNRVGQLLYETVQPAEQILTSGSDQPGSPGLLQNAYLLEFGSMMKNTVQDPPVDNPIPSGGVLPSIELGPVLPTDLYWVMIPALTDAGDDFWIPAEYRMPPTHGAVMGANLAGAIEWFYTYGDAVITEVCDNITFDSGGTHPAYSGVLFRGSDGVAVAAWKQGIGYTTTPSVTPITHLGLDNLTITEGAHTPVPGSILMAASSVNKARAGFVYGVSYRAGWWSGEIDRDIKAIGGATVNDTVNLAFPSQQCHLGTF